jgi:hypothetical protein
MKIIGHHYKAGFIFEAAFRLEGISTAKYTIIKKALVSPIQELDLLYDLGVSWLDDPASLPLSELLTVAQQEGVTAEEEADIRQILKSELRRLY